MGGDNCDTQLRMKARRYLQQKPHGLTFAWALLVFFPMVIGSIWYYQFGLLGWGIGSIGILGVVGPICVSLALRRREGESLHCPKCEYEFAGANGVEANHSDRCPECGLAWANRLRNGRLDPSWQAVALWSVATLIGSAVLLYGIANSRTRLIKVVPSFVLIDGIDRMRDAEDYELYTHWVELSSRSLTPTQTQRLADLLIDRLKRRSIGVVASEWLVKVLASNTLAPGTLERYLSERITSEAILRPPDSSGVRTLELRIMDHDELGFGHFIPVLAKSWVEPSETELAANAGWNTTRIAFPDSQAKNEQYFMLTMPVIAESRPSLRIPIPATVLESAKSKKGSRIRATVWLFFSPRTFVGSLVSPAQLVSVPKLDPRARLFRTIEFDIPVDSSLPPEKDAAPNGH